MQFCVHSLVCTQIMAYICIVGVMYVWNYLVYTPDLNSKHLINIKTISDYYPWYLHTFMHFIKYINSPRDYLTVWFRVQGLYTL